MNKGKLSGITIFMYGLSILLLLFTIYRLYGAMTYISSLVTEQSFIISENMRDVISYYYEQCASPFLFSVIIYVLGEVNEKLKHLLLKKGQLNPESELNNEQSSLN